MGNLLQGLEVFCTKSCFYLFEINSKKTFLASFSSLSTKVSVKRFSFFCRKLRFPNWSVNNRKLRKAVLIVQQR